LQDKHVALPVLVNEPVVDLAQAVPVAEVHYFSLAVHRQVLKEVAQVLRLLLGVPLIDHKLHHLGQAVVEDGANNINSLLLSLTMVDLSNHINQNAHNLSKFKALLAVLAALDQKRELRWQLVSVDRIGACQDEAIEQSGVHQVLSIDIILHIIAEYVLQALEFELHDVLHFPLAGELVRDSSLVLSLKSGG